MIFKGLIFIHRLFLGLIILGFIFWILDQHIPFAGKRVIEYTSGELNGIVTRPHPQDRVHTDEKRHLEKFIEEPIYFEVKTTLDYDAVTILVRYQNHASVPVQLGLKRSDRPGDVLLSPIQNQGSDGDWSLGKASFSLRDIPRIGGRYSFLFSMPGVQIEHPERGSVLLSHMTLTLNRKPANVADYTERIRSTLHL